MRESREFRVRARGAIACFTRPEMKVERVSYEVMTPSAARGVLEAIVWKPAIEWRVHAIEVLAPIRWTSFRRNEVASRASLAKKVLVADEDRQQRNTVALRDVDYVIHATFAMTPRAGVWRQPDHGEPRAGGDDSVRKFEEMMERRLSRGQHHAQPFLGCREFAADVEQAGETPHPIDRGIDRPLGWMFYDFDWTGMGGASEADAAPHTKSAPGKPLFFEARLASGVLHVPPRDAVRGGAR